MGALFSNTTGYSNTANGMNALYSNTTGNYNTALGNNSGYFIADGATANATSTNSIYLGANTKALASGDTNEIVIGYNATGLGSNTAVLGNSSITTTVLQGNVGIGTTAPSSILSVGGAGVSGAAIYASGTTGIYSVSSDPYGYGVYALAGGSKGTGIYASAGDFGVYSYGGSYGVYANGGSFGVYANGNNYDFYGGHGEYTNSSGQWINYSDRRLKTDIVPLSDSLSKIEMLTPVSFKWKDTATMGSQENIGLIAQDVQPVFPEFVSENASGTLGLNYAGFVSPIIGAIKEQQQEIELLKTQNATLQSEVNALLQKVK
jgi:hypothetical protein